MRFPPTGLFGAVMGVVGLGLASRAAAPLFPGLFRAPSYFTEPWIAAGTLLFAVLAVLFLWRVLAGKAKADFVEPERMGALGLVPISLTLVSAGVAPYAPGVADAAWWTSLVLYVAGLAWGVFRLAQLGFATPRVTPSWLVLLVGGIVIPSGGIALGHADIARWTFCSGLAAGLLLVVPLAKRPPLPEPARPAWFILLVPPSLISAHGSTLFHPGLAVFAWVALAVLAVLLVRARRLLRVPYSETMWAVTFPLDAFAFAASRQALAEQSHFWRAVAGLGLALALLAVLFCLYRTVRRNHA